ncbi:hypothetical protein MUU53_22770 [Rhizobium lemnae]|uniref:SMI1/KNR4 family protein n=1 Tax=Rhizobium lemnae TaxID=1214924 RepID=A0ABV8E808_9HYPH|nr:hypothetical protein [Rhizobium lemnae]MCJ8510671.1 hypothetical protein [Rhizobium lemnae]
MKKSLPLELTRACARSGVTLAMVAVRDTAEAFDPDGRFYRYDSIDPPPQNWTYSDFQFHIQSMTVFQNDDHPTPEGYFVLMSSEGDVYHTYWQENFREKIEGAGSWSADAKGYGRLTKIRQIGAHIYACGEGGQIYVRKGNNDWILLTDSVLYDPKFHRELMESVPDFDDPGYLDWMVAAASNNKDRDVLGRLA